MAVRVASTQRVKPAELGGLAESFGFETEVWSGRSSGSRDCGTGVNGVSYGDLRTEACDLGPAAIAVAVVGVLAALDFAAQPRAQTRTSPVIADGQTDYLDIPDAAPPVGNLRWESPRLQLMRAAHPTGNRVEDVPAFSRRLSSSARELDWPVIAVSQLDRGIEQRPGGGDHPDGQPPPLPTDRGDRLGRRASVDLALTRVVPRRRPTCRRLGECGG